VADVSAQPERHAVSGGRSRRDRIGAAEHALLGLIAVTERADHAGQGVHGYDLGRRFNDGPLAEIIRLEPGMLYHYLKKLGKAGLIATSIEPQSTRPDRQDHTLTPAGWAELEQWLETPVHATREIRLEFLVKLYFARQLDAGRASALVRAQRAVIADLLASLVGQRDALDPERTGADDGIRRSVLDLRVAQTHAVLGWLDALPEASPN